MTLVVTYAHEYGRGKGRGKRRGRGKKREGERGKERGRGRDQQLLASQFPHTSHLFCDLHLDLF